jgi:PIN domain nuclease of toxin-antitoxin system
MKLLLDTHALLWWLEDPHLLSKEARNAVRNGKNAVYVSAAVAWEIVIKKGLGKLEVPDNLEETLAQNRFLALPILVSHALAVEKLPLHHRDPFDRMLIAQAVHEGLTLVSRDSQVRQYPVSCIAA